MQCSKGQLISKCPFGRKTSSKIPTKLLPNFCHEIFCSFLGASWKLFWASCRLPYSIYYLLSSKEAQKASRKPAGSYKSEIRNPEIIMLLFWEKLIFHKDIIKLSDLQQIILHQKLSPAGLNSRIRGVFPQNSKTFDFHI